MSKKKVVMVTSIASPYRIPVWSHFAKSVDSLEVLLLAENDSNRIWSLPNLSELGFKFKILRGKNYFIKSMDWGIYINPTLFFDLVKRKPTHVLVTGYENLSYFTAILYAKLFRKKLTIWYGSHAMSSRSTSGIIPRIRQFLLTRADSYLTYGELTAQYLEEMGVSKNRISIGRNTINVKKLNGIVNGLGPKKRKAQEPMTFLYVGQFLPRKGVIETLRAFSEIDKDKAKMIIVGYGEQEQEIRDLIEERGLVNIEMVGATRSMEETAQYFAKSDVLLMPSFIEVWGLVVNEALASGLYVMSSKYAGSSYDLLKKAPFDCGILIDPKDHNGMVRDFKSILKKEFDKSLIMEWGLVHTPEYYGDRLTKAIEIS